MAVPALLAAPFLEGFATGAGLIIAIGAQNAFLLAKALRRQHPMIVAGICAFADAVLLTAGIGGAGLLISQSPILSQVAAWGGAVFLLWYGLLAARRAIHPGKLTAANDAAARQSLWDVVLATLAVTLLNPHVYLDTVVLVGSIGGRYPVDGRFWFGLGAVTASFVWFFSLAIGGRWLAPLFEKPAAWRFLEGLVCLVMWAVALSLIHSALTGF
ncbi:LysE/ArgO family amino acid transporter [Rhodovibrionaceae bacterium A322]